MRVILGTHVRPSLARSLCLVVLGIVLVAWPGGIMRAAQPLALPSFAGSPAVLVTPTVTVRISPATSAVEPGAQFSVDVVIVAGSEPVNAADVHLHFDPAYLAITKAPEPGLFLTSVAKSIYDNAAGTVSFGAYRTNDLALGTFTLCTLYLRSLKSSPTTLITYAQSPLVVSPGHLSYTVSTQNGTIVIAVPSPTPTFTPTRTPSPTITQTPSPTATYTPVPGNLCLAVYDDINRNQVYNAPAEPLLADALITVTDDMGATVVTYKTDGVHEPRCYSLPPNRPYTVAVVSPPGYVGLGPQTAFASLAPGVRLDVAFAQVPTSTATPAATGAPSHTPTSTVSATPTRTLTPTPVPTDAATLIRPSTGGSLTSEDLKVSIHVPAGAVTENVTLTLSYLDYGPSMPWNTWDRCLLAEGQVALFRGSQTDRSPVSSWDLPATLTMCHGPGGSVHGLALYRWDEGLDRWVEESTSWDEGGYCAQTETTHLGLFVVAWPDGCSRLPMIGKLYAPPQGGATISGDVARVAASLGAISGRVLLQGRPAPPDSSWAIPLQVTLYHSGGGLYTATVVTTDNEGAFSLGGIPVGTYDVLVKGAHTLAERRNGVSVVTSPTVNLGAIPLLEGDANNDNYVGAVDASFLASGYWKSKGQAGFVAGADLNEDGTIDARDASLLASNYGLAGD